MCYNDSDKGGVIMSNPVMRRLSEQSENEAVIDGNSLMTVNGSIEKTAFLGLILVVAAGIVWSKFTAGYTDIGTMLTGIGAIAGFITALIIIFARVKVLIPVYAALEGFFLGGISAIMESSYPGVVSQAVLGTFMTLFVMLMLYRANVIRCTEKFRSTVIIATASVVGIYLVDLIGHFFGYSVPVINEASTGGIIFSVVVVAIAALNLIIDFDFIEKGAQRMLPKKYEWFGAFGLMVTIVWLYLEILKLLAKTSRR